MSLLTNNVIPDNHGKVFGTNAMEEIDLLEIKKKLMELDGIKNVIVNLEIFPREFTVHTNKMVNITDIENKVKQIGFHAIPKDSFLL